MSTDNTLTMSTLATLPDDATFNADAAAALAIGNCGLAATENANRQLRDEAVWRAANGSL